MGKSRFSTLDVAAVAASLRARAVGLRVVNVYDAPGTHKVSVLWMCAQRHREGREEGRGARWPTCFNQSPTNPP